MVLSEQFLTVMITGMFANISCKLSNLDFIYKISLKTRDITLRCEGLYVHQQDTESRVLQNIEKRDEFFVEKSSQVTLLTHRPECFSNCVSQLRFLTV